MQELREGNIEIAGLRPGTLGCWWDGANTEEREGMAFTERKNCINTCRFLSENVFSFSEAW